MADPDANYETPALSLSADAPGISVDFNPQDFDDLIRGKGVKFVHFSAIRCPVGFNTMTDPRRTHPDHEGCSNGYLYSKEGCITAAMLGNSNKKEKLEAGQIDASNATVEVPRFYDDCPTKFCYVSPLDRLYLYDNHIQVPFWELVEYNNTGIDRLKYPATQVFKLIDSAGNSYQQGKDFDLKSGRIHWLEAGRRPQWKTEDNGESHGQVYSIRYLHKPFWYITRMDKEIRLAQVDGPNGREVIRMPQQVSVMREHFFESAEQDADSKVQNDGRQMIGVPQGQTGGR